MTNSQNDRPAEKSRTAEERPDLNLAGVTPGIAEQLRQFYRAVQDEAIPDRFVTLLEQLDQAEKRADQNHRVKDSA